MDHRWGAGHCRGHRSHSVVPLLAQEVSEACAAGQGPLLSLFGGSDGFCARCASA